MKSKFLPIVMTSLVLGMLFDFFFYGHSLGISFFLYCVLLLSVTLALAAYYKHTVNKSILILILPLLFFSAMIFVRANEFLIFLNVLSVLLLLLLIARLLLYPAREIWSYGSKDYGTRLLRFPLQAINEFFGFLRLLINSPSGKMQDKITVTPVVRGIALSVPILLIFLLLLSSADLVFRRYVGSLFDFQLSGEALFRIILVVFVASLFIGTYAFLFTKTKTAKESTDNKGQKLNLGTIESSIILGSVSLLFLIFVLIQLAYLFGGENHIASTGYTYAEYARKGFFELIAVAVISLGLILGVNNLTVRRSLQQKFLFMWLGGLLIIEVLVIMMSAHARLSLYEQTYGFTELRLYSHLFIAWLAVVFILLLAHIIRDDHNNKLAFQVFITLVAFMAATNLINPHAFIARQNIDRLNATGKIDQGYLSGLSDDAVPEISQLLNSSDENIKKSVASDFYIQKRALDSRNKSWQSFNISRATADKIFNANSKLLDENKAYSYPSLDD